MTIKPLFAWYDLWIGVFWDRKSRKLYILPIPCLGLVIQFRQPSIYYDPNFNPQDMVL